MINLHSRRFVGLDMDGVFCADIPWEKYLENMEATLAHRDMLPLLKTLPSFDHSRAVVITARPESEFSRTRAWLDGNGFSRLMLVCRPETLDQDFRSYSLYKAETVKRLECSDFLESEHEQALTIARIATSADVYHWDAEVGRAQLMQPHLVAAPEIEVSGHY